MLFKDEQKANAFSPIIFTDWGISILEILLQNLKALFPMIFRDGAKFTIMIDLQSLKAPSSMIDEGISIIQSINGSLRVNLTKSWSINLYG